MMKTYYRKRRREGMERSQSNVGKKEDGSTFQCVFLDVNIVHKIYM